MKRPTKRYDYIDDGPAIYVDSFATIRREADISAIPADAEKVAVRMVHGTGQVDLAGDLLIHPGLVAAARGALEAGAGAMQREAGVPAVVVYVVEAGIIIALLLADAWRRRTVAQSLPAGLPA